MKGSKVTFQLPFMAENDKKFSAKRFFNPVERFFVLSRLKCSMAERWLKYLSACNLNIMNALVLELKDEGSFYKIPV